MPASVAKKNKKTKKDQCWDITLCSLYLRQLEKKKDFQAL